MKLLWFLLAVVSLATAKPRRSLYVPGDSVCGFSSCPSYNASAQYIVHLVPHSHDDVGWLKTVDQYYYGARNSIQRAGVQYILDSVVKELVLDPTKRFIQVETAFFWRWWYEQNEEMQTMTRQLIQEGRLEFVGAGWSMNDEATTHYSAIVDNMALGFKTLGDLFDECAVPKVAWQIDPFGHSREQARIFAQMGFDGLFFARGDYRDKAQRRAAKNLQSVWQGSGKDSGFEDDAIYTGMFSDHYGSPYGLCFDILCSDDPIIDNDILEGVNVDEIMFILNLHILAESEFHRGPASKHLMFTMGDDFSYQNARQNYKNMDKLIKIANERFKGQTQVMYSTPSCYLKALHDEAVAQNVTDWPSVKTDDYFPYASNTHSYWTGYFTSRPNLKYMERLTNGLLQLSKQVEAQFEFRGKILGNQTDVDLLRRAMGTMQHHDAVTGTEKQHVADDYAMRMSQATKAALSQVGPALFGSIGLTPSPGSHDFTCPFLNISQCSHTEKNDQLSMIVYNPLARPISKILRFPILENRDVEIVDSDGIPLTVEYFPIPPEVSNIPGRQSEAKQEAVFTVTDIPALGFKSFYIKFINTKFPKSESKSSSDSKLDDLFRDYGIFPGLGYYLSTTDTDTQSSGAYIFRPESSNKTQFEYELGAEFIGTALTESWWYPLDTNYASFVTHEYAGSPHLEVEWLVGPLPDNRPGIEMVASYAASDENIQLGEPVVFHTDANGRQMVRRVLNQRSYNFTDGELEPVASNYYPVTSAITTGIFNESGDTGKVLSILNDRAQGGSCLTPNNCELMVHRRTFVDDRFGVGEALDEHAYGSPIVTRGKHYVFVGEPAEESRWRRSLSQELYMPLTMFFMPVEMSLEKWLVNEAPKVYKGLRVDSLPENVHIMTLERWGEYENNEVLLRFEHLYEEGEHPELSKPATFDLTSDMFRGFVIESVTEMSLGGNVPIQVMRQNRLQWTTKGMKEDKEFFSPNTALPVAVTLEPMEIRTFIATISSMTDKAVIERVGL